MKPSDERTVDLVAEESRITPGRCPASVMPGQQCGRPVADDADLCANHLAMGWLTV